jgi:hypothetical protein
VLNASKCLEITFSELLALESCVIYYTPRRRGGNYVHCNGQSFEILLDLESVTARTSSLTLGQRDLAILTFDNFRNLLKWMGKYRRIWQIFLHKQSLRQLSFRKSFDEIFHGFIILNSK